MSFSRAIVSAGVLSLLVAGNLHSRQRHYVLSTSANVTSGADNQNTRLRLPTSSSRETRPLVMTNGVFPSLTLTSMESRAELSGTYSYGYNRRETDPSVSSHSHSARVRFSRPLGPSWRLTLSESFESTEDSSSFNALRGVSSITEDTDLLFYPLGVSVTSRSNRAQVGAGYQVGANTSLSFNVGHSLRDYAGSTEVLGGRLSNQQSFTATSSFNRRISTNDSWGLSYAGSYSHFENFPGSRYHAVSASYATTLARDTTADFQVGAAYVQSAASISAEQSYIGYNASVNIQKTLQTGTFTARYDQNSGQPGGLGSTSNTRRAGLSWRQDIARGLNMFADVGAFQIQGTLDNTLEAVGYSGSGSLEYALSRNVGLRGGARFQKSLRSGFDFTQRHIFFSITYHNDRLLSF